MGGKGEQGKERARKGECRRMGDACMMLGSWRHSASVYFPVIVLSSVSLLLCGPLASCDADQKPLKEEMGGLLGAGHCPAEGTNGVPDRPGSKRGSQESGASG